MSRSNSFGSAVLFLLLAAGAARAQSEIYSNASPNPADPGLATGPVTIGGIPAPGGYVWSEVQSSSASESNAIAGFSSHAWPPGAAYRFADDFTVPPGRVWRIDAVAFFAYQTGAPLPPGVSPFSGLNLEILDRDPSDPASTVLFGDTSTNRAAASQATNILRVFNGQVTPLGPSPDSSRLVWRTDALVAGVVLRPGTYWLSWQYTTIDPDGVAFSPAAIAPGQRTLPGWNALQLKSTGWTPALDTGKPDFAPDLAQDFPFILSGIDTCSADFNLDGSIDADDLGDFINCYFGETGSPGVCPDADFNQDGAVDPDDLGDFINIYFGGC